MILHYIYKSQYTSLASAVHFMTMHNRAFFHSALHLQRTTPHCNALDCQKKCSSARLYDQMDQPGSGVEVIIVESSLHWWRGVCGIVPNTRQHAQCIVIWSEDKALHSLRALPTPQCANVDLSGQVVMVDKCKLGTYKMVTNSLRLRIVQLWQYTLPSKSIVQRLQRLTIEGFLAPGAVFYSVLRNGAVFYSVLRESCAVFYSVLR